MLKTYFKCKIKLLLYLRVLCVNLSLTYIQVCYTV